MTILVKYSCHVCGLVDAPVHVEARGVEDIRVWMDTTIRQVGRDHAGRAPHCQTTQLANLKIPITGVDRLGGPPTH